MFRSLSLILSLLMVFAAAQIALPKEPRSEIGGTAENAVPDQTGSACEATQLPLHRDHLEVRKG